MFNICYLYFHSFYRLLSTYVYRNILLICKFQFSMKYYLACCNLSNSKDYKIVPLPIVIYNDPL